MWQGCKPSNGTKLFLQNISFITYDMAQLLWTVSNVMKCAIWVLHACLWIYIASLQIIIGGASEQWLW